MSTKKKITEERLYYSPPALRKQKQQQTKLKSSPLSQKTDSASNLDRFLEHTIPLVPAHQFSKTSMKQWRNRKIEFCTFFILGDLWESFREWSVYGAGVPLVMNGNESVIQYYVPSLSAIQLYTEPSTRRVEQRRPGEESDANSSRETSSGGNSEYENDIGANNWRPIERSNPSMESSTNNCSDISNPPGLLAFEYFERELPFHREPLADKMSKLASRFPALKTYQSCDLTPSSWISVAWYPIYRIPVGPTLQNLDACFLTFHSLAKPVTSSERGNDTGSKLSLPTFGLVPYKFNVSDWTTSAIYEGQKVDSLLHAADNWLRSLQVNHPDYSFFSAHNTYRR